MTTRVTVETPGMKEVRPGVWRLRVFTGLRKPNGAPIQSTKTVVGIEGKAGSGKRAAQNELTRMRAAAVNGTMPAGSTTVRELLERYIEHSDVRGRKPTTLREYRRLANQVIIPELGHLRLSKLTASHLDGLYARLTKQGLRATSVRRVHALLSAALHQAEKWDMVHRDVARRATPPVVHAAQVTAPSPTEVRALVAGAEEMDPTLAALLLLAALTGARRGELCALRWNDFDSDNAVLTIARSVYDEPGGGWGETDTKTHASRRIGLDELAMVTLKRHRQRLEAEAESLDLGPLAPDAFMFSLSPAGTEPIRPDYLTKFTLRAAKAANVNITLKSLRHFSVTEGIAAGSDVRTVAGRHGHADASVTLRTYAHVIERRDREVAAAVGRSLALPS
jgi:integrase